MTSADFTTTSASLYGRVATIVRKYTKPAGSRGSNQCGPRRAEVIEHHHVLTGDRPDDATGGHPPPVRRFSIDANSMSRPSRRLSSSRKICARLMPPTSGMTPSPKRQRSGRIYAYSRRTLPLLASFINSWQRGRHDQDYPCPDKWHPDRRKCVCRGSGRRAAASGASGFLSRAPVAE